MSKSPKTSVAGVIDWDTLWAAATKRFALGPQSLHGPRHWRNVERNAVQLAADTGADIVVLRLFAVLHDSCRLNEMHDPEHGARAAHWSEQLRGQHFDLADIQFAQLTRSMIDHDKGMTSDNVTIGTCWDADRLDLNRVGIVPSATYISTHAGKAIVQRGWPFIR